MRRRLVLYFERSTHAIGVFRNARCSPFPLVALVLGLPVKRVFDGQAFTYRLTKALTSTQTVP